MKLSDDAGYTGFEMEGYSKGFDIDHERVIYTSILEMYWKTAELAGQSLQIRPNRKEISNFSYIKLVPLTEEEQQFELQLQPTKQTKKVAIIGQAKLGGSTSGDAKANVPKKKHRESSVVL